MSDYWDRIDRQARAEGVVCFLQNAWSPVYAGRQWPRAAWLQALRRSRSGKRLRLLVRNPAWCHNTTAVVGETASSRPPADPVHMRRILDDYRPKVVIACGRQAERALETLWESTLLVVPHPAHRLLTDQLYLHARELLDQLISQPGRRVRLSQKVGTILQEED